MNLSLWQSFCSYHVLVLVLGKEFLNQNKKKVYLKIEILNLHNLLTAAVQKT